MRAAENAVAGASAGIGHNSRVVPADELAHLRRPTPKYTPDQLAQAVYMGRDAYRVSCCRNGWHVVPLRSSDQSNGDPNAVHGSKVPILNGWQKVEGFPDEITIESWKDEWHGPGMGTGIRTGEQLTASGKRRYVHTIDIDVDGVLEELVGVALADAQRKFALVTLLYSLAEKHFAEFLARTGFFGRLTLIVISDTKVEFGPMIQFGADSNNHFDHIDFRCATGQQVVADAVHPHVYADGTQDRYRWLDDRGPHNVVMSEMLAITQEDATGFVNDIIENITGAVRQNRTGDMMNIKDKATKSPKAKETAAAKRERLAKEAAKSRENARLEEEAANADLENELDANGETASLVVRKYRPYEPTPFVKAMQSGDAAKEEHLIGAKAEISPENGTPFTTRSGRQITLGGDFDPYVEVKTGLIVGKRDLYSRDVAGKLLLQRSLCLHGEAPEDVKEDVAVLLNQILRTDCELTNVGGPKFGTIGRAREAVDRALHDIGKRSPDPRFAPYDEKFAAMVLSATASQPAEKKAADQALADDATKHYDALQAAALQGPQELAATIARLRAERDELARSLMNGGAS